jgi:hypothetical protein
MSMARPPELRRPSRREVLIGAGVLVASGCARAAVDVAPRPTADQRLAADVAEEIRALAARYAATVRRHPGLGGVLSPLAAEHDAHVRALVALQPVASPSPSASAAGSAAGSAAASPSVSPTAAAVPATPAAARAALVEAERVAAQRRRRQSLRAGAGLARLLASVAACESVHAALLGEG